MKTIIAFGLSLIVLLLSACSAGNVGMTPGVATISPGRDITPTQSFSPIPAPTLSESLQLQASTPTPIRLTVIPRTWAALSLTGQLVFILSDPDAQNSMGFALTVAKLDLASGQLTTLFQPPDNAWVTAAAVSPDGQQMVIQYAPPPTPGQVQFGYSGLYLLPMEGSGSPQPLLAPSVKHESYFQPAWSPDGRYIYYVHLTTFQNNNGLLESRYTVERLAYPDGQPEKVAENAYWPRLSPDGTHLVYVTFDPGSYTSKLYQAQPGGTNAAPIDLPDEFVVDAPLFSADGQWIIFSAADLGASPTSLSWLDQLMGVHVAEAHSIPSDWWRVPVAGGQREQLTELADAGLFGAFAPDGRHMAFVSLSGLFVMQPDGTDLTLLLPDLGVSGTVDWIP